MFENNQVCRIVSHKRNRSFLFNTDRKLVCDFLFSLGPSFSNSTSSPSSLRIRCCIGVFCYSLPRFPGVGNQRFPSFCLQVQLASVH